METQYNLDSIQEALRIIYLENAKEHSVSTQKQMPFLLSSETQMNDDKKELLLKKLNDVMCSLTFGELLQQSIQQLGISETLIAEKTDLPITVIKELQQDAIYTNNVPIVFLKELLVQLNLSFDTAEQAIRKTFDSLQIQIVVKTGSYSGYSPAFRKSNDFSRQSITDSRLKTDGKELFENREALDKYLARLDNLLNK